MNKRSFSFHYNISYMKWNTEYHIMYIHIYNKKSCSHQFIGSGRSKLTIFDLKFSILSKWDFSEMLQKSANFAPEQKPQKNVKIEVVMMIRA